jgi:hypothetical protein
MMRVIRLSLIGMVMLSALPAGAEIYTYIDAEGKRVFTDRPDGRAAEPTQTKTPNSMPAQPVTPTEKPGRVKVLKAPVPGYERLDILQPAPDMTIRDNAGALTISVSSEPPLHPGHQYRALLDGIPMGSPGTSAAMSLPHVDRGTHQLVVEIVDANGESVQRSEPRIFHMMRTSLSQRRKANPCKVDDYGVRPECPLKDKPEEKKGIPFVPFL